MTGQSKKLLPRHMNIENAKEWMLKIANSETDIKGNDKQNEEQRTEILEIPKMTMKIYLTLKI